MGCLRLTSMEEETTLLKVVYRAENKCVGKEQGAKIIPLHVGVVALGYGIGKGIGNFREGKGFFSGKYNMNSARGRYYSNQNAMKGMIADGGGMTDVTHALGEIEVVANRVSSEVKGAIGFAAGMAGGVYDFVDTYLEMRSADWKESDKYFHSKANYRAALRGDGGEYVAEKISNIREIWDQNVKGYPRWDSVADQKANFYGRSQGRYYRNLARPGYKNALPEYRPHNLPSQY